MKKIFFILFLILFLFSCKKEEPNYKEFVVTVDVLNVRQSPNNTSKILGRVSFGDTLFVNMNYKNEEFVEVFYNGKKYYVSKAYIREKESIFDSEDQDYIEETYENMDSNEEEELETEDYEFKKEDTEITIDNYPIVDGHTALMPFMAKIRSEILGEDIIISQNNTRVTWTDSEEIWSSLRNGNNDLIITYEASEETKKVIENSNEDLIITPIGIDALVFLVNENNEVNNLSRDELKKIYTGEIDNWKEVGGPDIKIKTFQTDGVTRIVFLNSLMEGEEPKEPLKYDSYYLNEEDVSFVAEYDNKENSIGYGLYYYVEKMYMKKDIKLLNVDGISPNDSTIANREYPFLNNFYVAIRKNIDEESPTKKLYDYIISKEGRELLIKMGYIPYDE